MQDDTLMRDEKSSSLRAQKNQDRHARHKIATIWFEIYYIDKWRVPVFQAVIEIFMMLDQ